MPERDELAARLAEISCRHPGSQPELIAEVVRAVLSTLSGDLSAHQTTLLAEVEELGRTIASAKAEIAALRIDDIKDNHIPFATDELDAIVEHTATATNAILSSCETLDEVAAKVEGDAAALLQTATTQIYEACSFQDITGQRITKVVTTLKAIETKVAQIVRTFGGGAPAPVAEAPTKPEEVTLENGPQLPTAAMDQSDIDKLLASFE
jgi:chemotaxis protein CheZ